MTVTGKTKVYGIFGNPVEHSFSPVIQNAAFKALNLDCLYAPFQVSNLPDAVKGMKAMNIQGLSITIPFKVEILSLLDEIDPLAEKIGAVNTVVNQKGVLKGYNTDGAGALEALKEITPVKDKTILILGYGGAARPIAFALSQEKPKAIYIAGRKESEAGKLAKEIQDKTGILTDRQPWQQALDYDILINTTPAGMWPHAQETPWPENLLIPETVVFDIVYRPKETLLLSQAKKKGCVLVYGDRMLVYQGAEQFRLWTGQAAPLEMMNQAMKKLLEHP